MSIFDELKSRGKILGVEVTDHIIVTKDKFFSFKKKR
jgi:DNA repair protein RadC